MHKINSILALSLMALSLQACKKDWTLLGLLPYHYDGQTRLDFGAQHKVYNPYALDYLEYIPSRTECDLRHQSGISGTYRTLAELNAILLEKSNLSTTTKERIKIILEHIQPVKK